MDKQARVRRIALTGGIATGKSTVRARLQQLGVPTVDADVLARDVAAPGTPGFAAIVARFGPTVVDADGFLNRRALGAIVFADPVARRDLEAIIHPAVRAAIDAWFASLDPAAHPFGVADIPLLFETGREADFDAVILTIAPPATQLARLMRRDGLTEAEAQRRITAQLPPSEKVHRSDYVVDTNGTVNDTERQVDKIYAQLDRYSRELSR